MFKIILFTFEQSLASVFIALLAGIPGAYFISRKNFLARKLLLSLSSIPLCIPALIAALGYISAFGLSGFYNKLLMNIFSLKEAPLKFLYSFMGICITQGFYNFPIIMKSTADLLSALDKSPEESAALLGAGQVRIFFTITLPRIIPAIIAGAVPVFIFCYFSFMIILMLGIPGTSTLETEIFFAARTHQPFSKVLLLCSVETLLAMAMIFIWTLTEKKGEINRENAFISRPLTRSRITKAELPFFTIYIVIIFLFFIIPFLSIPLNSLTGPNDKSLSLKYWSFVFNSRSFIPSLVNSIIQAGITAFLCLIPAIFFAFLTRTITSYQLQYVFKIIPLIPMAISSVATSVVILYILAKSPYQTSMLTLCFAQSFLYWPFAYKQIYSSAAKIPDEVIYSARLLSPGRLQFIREIFIPYTHRSIRGAFLFTFAISIGDASIPLVLAIPEYTSLSIFTYRLFGYRFPAACASSVLLGTICILLSLIALREEKES
ncbi:iron ABC transporter permease [Treponema sp.]|uniref:ABC transporter permease n=1 Tax=Treponema sp. TaxID=166 RepID=UPI0025D93349|nr:ABC transporter permease subunit [Treponema sp.]MCR5217601.1 ABC transporter permease subunit [Treponema sp.]